MGLKTFPLQSVTPHGKFCFLSIQMKLEKRWHGSKGLTESADSQAGGPQVDTDMWTVYAMTAKEPEFLL